jgi:hypothetical protein
MNRRTEIETVAGFLNGEFGLGEVAAEPTSAAETLAAFWDRVPMPSYAESVAAATVAAVATVQRFEGDAVEFEEFPWLLELWPGRVAAIDTQDDVLGWL